MPRGTPFLNGKKRGKDPFKGRTPLLGFLPLNIPTSQLNGASHLQLRLTAQVKLCLTRAAARSSEKYSASKSRIPTICAGAQPSKSLARRIATD